MSQHQAYMEISMRGTYTRNNTTAGLHSVTCANGSKSLETTRE